MDEFRDRLPDVAQGAVAAALRRSARENLRTPPPQEFLQGAHVHVAVVQEIVQFGHPTPQECTILVHRVAGEGSDPGPTPIAQPGEDLLLDRGLVEWGLFHQLHEPGVPVMGGVPLVHGREHGVGLAHDEIGTLLDLGELTVTEHHRDLEDAIAIGVETRHLEVHPHEGLRHWHFGLHSVVSPVLGSAAPRDEPFDIADRGEAPLLRILITPGALLLGMTLLGPRIAVAEPDLRPLLTASLEVYNELASDPLPFLSASQVDALVEGEVVRIRRRRSERDDAATTPERVTGYIVIREPRVRVWLASLDPTFQASSMLTEVRLRFDEAGASQWYQHLSLPWPIADRHWVIDLGKRVELCEATEGLIWEQYWWLAENGPEIARAAVAAGRAGDLTLESIEDAIYLPANDGAWILFSVTEDVTFLAYRVTSVVGGGIPDSWITTFAMAQLEGLLRKVEEHAARAWLDYDPDRYVIHGGDGNVIPRLHE